MRRNIAHAALALVLASLPASAYAALLISEVSYDPPGTDSKREWIEVENVGSAPVPISIVRFFESGVAHKITAFGTSSTSIPPGTFAVIADNAASFLLDYPTYTGALYDSAFSLTNTGEVLVITIDGVEVDSVPYVSTEGAAGTGASLTRVNAGFMPARPSPGSRNGSDRWDGDTDSGSSGGTTATNTGSTAGASATSTHTSSVPVSTYVPKVDFQVHAGRDRSVSINTPLTFEASAKGAAEGFGARWSFGDGEFERGSKVVKEYMRSGAFVVVLNAVARGVGEKSVDRLMVDVFEPSVSLNIESNEYVLKNVSGREINLGGFHYRDGEERLREWVEDTIVLDSGSVRIESTEPKPCGLKISYPNGVELLPINCTAGVQSPHDGYP
jgi:hypothetical protein